MISEQVNEALSSIKYPWINEEGKHVIASLYGSVVLKQIEEIYSIAVNDKAWTTLSYSEAISEIKQGLHRNYPDLSEESISKLANMAAYNWK